MKKSKSKVIRIGGNALEVLKELRNTTFRTYKGSAEYLIDLGKARLEMFGVFKKGMEKKNKVDENRENCNEN